MSDRPILMSAPMVRAILAGTKTQTRRVVKPQPFRDPSTHGYQWHGGAALLRAGYGARYVHTNLEPMKRAVMKCCPYGQPGDRLWVRETWAKWGVDYQGGEGPSKHEEPIYRADGDPWDERDKWRPGMFMPRWASRITLEATGVRVERLQDISEADAMAEGCETEHPDTAVGAYEWLWESIHGPGSWDANPWVWVVSFQRQEGGHG